VRKYGLDVRSYKSDLAVRFGKLFSESSLITAGQERSKAMKKALVLISMVGLGFLIAWGVSEDTSLQKAELESLKAEVQQLTTDIGKTEIERDTLKVRIALAEKNRDELQEQAEKLTESRAKLQEQVEEFSFSRDQSRQQLDEIIVTRDNLKKQFAELAGSRDNLQQQLDELAASRNQLRRKVSELTMSSNAAIADVQIAQERIDKLVAMLEGETQKPAEPQAELIVINQEAEDIQPPMIEVDRRPALQSFNTNRLRIMPGQTSTLSWQVSNAQRIRIEPEVGQVTALGSRTVKPSAATTYTLIAANEAGESRQTCRVEVGEAPAVQSKVVEQPAADTELVEPVVISSEVVEPHVVISEIVEPPVVSSQVVEPVVISSEAGERPTCHSFNTNRPRIMPGQSSTLSWQVSNAQRIRIEPDVGPVSALGSRTVKPSVATTYTLIAGNKAGESRQTCRVEVGEAPAVQSQDIEQPAVLTEVVEPPVVTSQAVEPAAVSSEVSELPALHSFNTTRPVIMSGQTSTLSWQVSNAERIRIEPEVGLVSALGSRTVKPFATTTYTLIATNQAGDNKLSQNIEVSERINIFSSDSIGSRELLEEYKASEDSQVLPGQKLPVSDPNAKLGKFLGYRALKDESGKFIFIPVYENKQEE
jgi:prefoldin subunit 5